MILWEKFKRNVIATWKKLLSDYKIRHWKASDLPIEVPYVRKMYENKRWAYLSDYMRLYALYHYGGIYLDLDVEILKSLNDLLENNFFISYELKDREHFQSHLHCFCKETFFSEKWT